MTRTPLLVAALFCFSCIIPLHAQQLTITPAQILEQEKNKLEAAKRWAAERSIPEFLLLNDESIISVVGIQNNHPVYFTTHNQHASFITRTSPLQSGGSLNLNLTGSTITIGVWDASLVFENHQEHSSRVIRKETGGAGNHATHVAGTLIATGILNEAKGMAPKARLHSYNWNFHSSEMISEAEKGLLVSNHSYGRIGGWHKFNLTPDSSRWQWFGDPNISTDEDYVFGYYDEEAATFDHIVYTNPHYLPVISAGNERDDLGPSSGIYLALDNQNRWREYDIATRPVSPDGDPGGFDTITSMALAKNVLTVGSISSDSLNAAINLSVFSSAGPTDDGRIKPDIVGLGEQLFSTIASGSTEYATYSGTSMATPNIAGSLVLLQQLHHQLFGTYMSAATLKGLAIHTATDIGTPGPDYQTGWGLMNTEKAALALQKGFRSPSTVQEEVLFADSLYTLNLLSREGSDIRATLSWTDPRFTPITSGTAEILDNPTPTLVHDLNLRLIHKPTNKTYLPYTLIANDPTQAAVPGVNNVDPVEQIYVENAPPGLYSLIVDAPAGLSHSTSQSFSLLVSGLEDRVTTILLDSARVTADLGDVYFEWSTLSQNADGVFIVERAREVTSASNSTPSVLFQTIATIESQGVSQEIESYSFNDPVFLTGVYRYRLLFEAANSLNKVFLQEFEVDIPAPANVQIASVYPNPATHNTTLILDLPEAQPITLDLYNALGQHLITHSESRLDAGRHFITLDISSFSQGTYFARIITSTHSLQRSIVIVE